MTKDRRPKGSGSEWKDSQGIWHARKNLPKDPATGKVRRISATGKSKTEAREKLEAKMQALQKRGVVPSKKTPKLEDYISLWLERTAQRVKPRVLETYRSDCKAITSMIGALRLDEITAAQVESMLTQLGTTRKSKTIKNYYIRLKQVLTQALKDGLIQTNPLIIMDPPRVDASETQILQSGQPALAINTYKTIEFSNQSNIRDSEREQHLWTLMFEIAFATGMRQGERFAITPSELVTIDGVHGIQIDWELQRLTGTPVLPNWLEAKQLSEHMWLIPPKSQKGKRFVPISTSLWIALQQLITLNNISADSLIFTMDDGRPFSQKMEAARWKLALSQAGLPYVTMRSARHFFSTQLAKAGASEDARKAIMGHAKISTTAGYTHWQPSVLSQYAALAGKAITE